MTHPHQPDLDDKTANTLVADWRLIPLHEYKRPAEPAHETVRSGLHQLWNYLYRQVQESRLFADAEPEEERAAPELQTAPQGLLDRIAPTPKWQEYGTIAIEQALQSWHEQPEEAGLQALVGAPYSGLSEMAIGWSKAHDYALIKPPTPTQILNNDARWLQQWQQNEAERLVLPCLERCYLRHHNGLDLLRRLLDWLWETETPSLLVADSWAWSFLKQVYHIDALCPYPQTLAPLEPEAVVAWFYALAHYEQQHRFVFRQANNGYRVLLPATNRMENEQADESPETDEKNQDDDYSEEFIRYLAARSRGIPGVAWSLWRHSLQIAADEAVRQDVQDKAAADEGVTIWVTPWAELTLPTVPSHLDEDETFILHTLLLHNGLDEAVLAMLLPTSPVRVLRALHHLQSLHLITANVDEGKRWTVTPLAYGAVRAYLSSEGYLVDEL